jgi:hypothetical protein
LGAAADAAPGSTAPPATSAARATVATTLPTTSTAPPTTIETVKVPRLAGMDLAAAKATLADRGLRARMGNGPEYVDGPIRVRPPDPFDLDREGDGWGCESG